MSGKKTLLWALALLVLGGFYYYYEIRGEPKRQEAARQRELLLSLAAEDITGLSLTRAQEVMTATRSDGHWQLTAPLKVPGDDKKYQELVRTLVDLRHTRLVEENPTSLEPFGLTTPSLEVAIQLKNQDKPQTLRLGTKNPTSSSYYAQVVGRNTVYLVASVAKDTLDASLHDLRDKTVLAFNADEAQEVHIIDKDNPPLILHRQEKDTWELTAPVQAAADLAQVREVLKRLREVRVKEFIEETPSSLASYGLDAPALRLEVRRGGESPLPALLLGNVAAEKQGIYARRSDAERVMLLPKDFWEGLPKTARALRNKTLFKYDRDHIVRLEMQTPDTHLVLTSTAPQHYTLEQPEQAPGDGNAISRLLWDILELKATDIVTDTPETLASYGLETPRWRLTLMEKPPAEESPRTHTFVVGSDAPDGQGLYVQRAPEATVYVVERQTVERLFTTTAFDLRDKRIFHFERDSIAKIHVQYPTAQWTMERQGKDWRLTAPKVQEISQRWKVENLLSTLHELEYAKIVAHPAEEAGRYGLDTPQVTVTLWQQDGTMLGPLVIGNTTDTEVPGMQAAYARSSSETTPVYAIKIDFLEQIPKEPAELTAKN